MQFHSNIWFLSSLNSLFHFKGWVSFSITFCQFRHMTLRNMIIRKRRFDNHFTYLESYLNRFWDCWTSFVSPNMWFKKLGPKKWLLGKQLENVKKFKLDYSIVIQPYLDHYYQILHCNRYISIYWNLWILSHEYWCISRNPAWSANCGPVP